ncbi:peptide/nickel transport system permease protein [Paenibacillus algorifonticola]|uniref:Peptide/nickel transport system permease protein n=1 Tax=Paenibacillus algorifonticola TaxID=684063 RepID=A0A1I2IWY2_9BACL|nr:ABC transporter permease [Paenibacillus algorifonticola]SFF46699.1 peptide/nickel transport system permease protein [Paenibacillus algorifonticola]
MGSYIGRRILTGTLTIILAIIFSFLLIHLAPGNPVSILSGRDNPSPEMEAALIAKYGLDQSVFVQLGSYLKNIVQGDLGQSISNNRPVVEMIAERIGPTLLLSLTTAILSLLIGTALGIYCARSAGSKLDSALNGISYLFDAMPGFWLGMMLILLFASGLKLLPTAGMVDLRADYTGFAHYLDVLKHLILPGLTLTLISTPYFFRIARSSVIQVMSEDFVNTLRATGMKESRIFNKYVFKNAILPTVTVFGITLAYIFTGVAIIEIVFSWPGMGSFMLKAISSRDYPLLMGIYLILSVSVAVNMIIVDLLYAFIDPRIRYK